MLDWLRRNEAPVAAAIITVCAFGGWFDLPCEITRRRANAAQLENVQAEPTGCPNDAIIQDGEGHTHRARELRRLELHLVDRA